MRYKFPEDFFWGASTSAHQVEGNNHNDWSDILSPYIGYITYPLPPKFFWLKANIAHLFYGDDKKIIVSELQAEPWGPEFSQIVRVEGGQRYYEP